VLLDHRSVGGRQKRRGLCADLGLSDADRHENIRSAGEVARLMVDASLVGICAFVSPFALDRERVRQLFPEGRLAEVYPVLPHTMVAELLSRPNNDQIR
jgi:adenylylsulfate kinase-like enzyme